MSPYDQALSPPSTLHMKLFFRFRKRRAMADRTTFKKRMSPGTRKTTFPPLAIGIDGTTVPSAPVPCLETDFEQNSTIKKRFYYQLITNPDTSSNL